MPRCAHPTRCSPPSATGRGAGPPSASVGPRQNGDHVYALPGALQCPDASAPPLSGLWLCEYACGDWGPSPAPAFAHAIPASSVRLQLNPSPGQLSSLGWHTGRGVSTAGLAVPSMVKQCAMSLLSWDGRWAQRVNWLPEASFSDPPVH